MTQNIHFDNHDLEIRSYDSSYSGCRSFPYPYTTSTVFSERCAGTHILPKILPFLDCVVFVFVNFHFDLFGTAGIFHL